MFKDKFLYNFLRAYIIYPQRYFLLIFINLFQNIVKVTLINILMIFFKNQHKIGILNLLSSFLVCMKKVRAASKYIFFGEVS